MGLYAGDAGATKISFSETMKHEARLTICRRRRGICRGCGCFASVSIKKNETNQHVQYLGDDGEVGEVGEYFGEAGVINAGAICRSTGQSLYDKIYYSHSHAAN